MIPFTEEQAPSRLHWETLSDTAGDFLAEAAVARAENLVRGVALLGPQSRNGYHYTAAAMEAAVPLYQSRPLFIDHPDQGPTQRKLRDFAGQVLNPRFENQRLRGDLRLLGPNAPWLLDLIEAAPAEVGLSHVILGRRSSDGSRVERIDKVVSVDIVAFPATTQTFKEQAPAAAGCAASPGCPLPAGLKNHFASLRQRVAASRIPPEAHAAVLEQLLAYPADVGRTLQALEEFWLAAQQDRPRCRERQGSTQASRTFDQAITAAIRGH